MRFIKELSKKNLLFIIPWILGQAQAAVPSTLQSDTIKIACIGNSITAGARTEHPESESYPAVLETLLHNTGFANYKVKNFGIGGATIIKYGSPNLWQQLKGLEDYKPDIVIIKAGTNETVGKPRYNWEHIVDYERDYVDYINHIKEINPHCQIIVCSPLDFALKTMGLTTERLHDLKIRRPRIWELRERVRAIAKLQHYYFLDLTKPFKGKTELITAGDGVHPNIKGYQYLAKLVFSFLVHQQLIIKASK